MIRRLGRDSEEGVTRVLAVVLALGALAAPFYSTEVVRAQLLGETPPPPLATPVVLCTGLALAWYSLLRRDFAWADPAWLTWADFAGTRPRLITRRLLAAWAFRFGAVGYATVASGVLFGCPNIPLTAGFFVVIALLGLAAARRSPRLPWVERTAPLLLIAVPLTGFTLNWLWLPVVACALVGLLPGRTLAADAGRADLIRRFTERSVRRTSLAFLDMLALLPAGRVMRRARVLDGRGVLARFVVAGLLARNRALPLAGLLVLAVAMLHRLFPAVDPVWWLGVGGYLAVLPFSGALAQLHQVPGLRRWVGCSDRTLRASAAGVLIVAVAVWAAVLALLGVPLSWSAGLAVLVAGAAIVRTVTRAPINFANLGLVSVMGVLVPVGLLAQLAHGPDLLVLGLFLMGALGLGVAAPIVLGLSAAAVLGAPTARP